MFLGRFLNRMSDSRSERRYQAYSHQSHLASVGLSCRRHRNFDGLNASAMKSFHFISFHFVSHVRKQCFYKLVNDCDDSCIHGACGVSHRTHWLKRAYLLRGLVGSLQRLKFRNGFEGRSECHRLLFEAARCQSTDAHG
jgi:hypothetical protein